MKKKPTGRREGKRPTARELGILLRDITGRMPRIPYTDREVAIDKIDYNGKDKFELYWRDEANNRHKQRYDNWRHAVAAAKWVNAKLEAAKGKTAFTFNDAAEAFLKKCEGRVRTRQGNLSERTLYNHRIHLKQIQAQFGEILLHDIKTQKIDDWLLKESERLKYSSLDARRSLINQVMKFAVHREPQMVAVNPFVARPIELPGKPSTKVEVPSPSNMRALKALMDAAKPWGRAHIMWSGMRVAIMLAASCGLRIQDICGLRWDHIDHEFGEVNIKDSVKGGWGRMLHIGPPKTPAGIRKVPLPFSGRKIISEHAEVYKDFFGEEHGWPVGFVVRPSRANTKRPYQNPKTLSDLFRRLVTKTKNPILNPDGTPLHFHQLRHWFAAVGVKHHSDKHYVKKIIGHSKLSMLLDTYADYIDTPAAREEFLAMPDWLDPDRIAVPAQPMLPAPTPVMIRSNGGAPEILGTAENVVIEAAAPEGEAVARRPCPLDVPDATPDWLRTYITMIDDGRLQADACRTLGIPTAEVVKALRVYLKIGGQLELKRRLRRKKIAKLIDQDHGDMAIAMKLGLRHTSRAIPMQVRQELRKDGEPNLLKTKNKARSKPKLDSRPKHKGQLKLL